MRKIAYIYKITNVKNGKIYIGSTTKLPNLRWNQHVYDCKNKSNLTIHKAMRKYGIKSFTFEVICTVLQIEHLDALEDLFITTLGSMRNINGYNMIGVQKNRRSYITKCLKADWENPEKRAVRIKNMIKGSKHKYKAIVAISIYSGEVRRFESVHAAMREGFSAPSIYGCLTEGRKKGEGYTWFYASVDLSDVEWQAKALSVLGSFNKQYTLPIVGTETSTGKTKEYKTAFDTRQDGFKPKMVTACIRGLFKTTLGWSWKFKPSIE